MSFAVLSFIWREPPQQAQLHPAALQSSMRSNILMDQKFIRNLVNILLYLLKRCYMNLLQNVERWGDMHHPKWLDILRICFGIFLCFKGVQLLNNIDGLQSLMTNKLSYGSFSLVLLSHYVVFAHLIGGFFVAIGFLTRLACLIQIPILLGAIIFVNSSGNDPRPVSELILSIVALILLVYFLIVGSGQWSVNRFIDHENSMHVNR